MAYNFFLSRPSRLKHLVVFLLILAAVLIFYSKNFKDRDYYQSFIIGYGVEIGGQPVQDLSVNLDERGQINSPKLIFPVRVHRTKDYDEVRMLIIEEPGQNFQKITVNLNRPKQIAPPHAEFLAIHGVEEKSIYEQDGATVFEARNIGPKAVLTLVASWPRETFKLGLLARFGDWITLQPDSIWLGAAIGTIVLSFSFAVFSMGISTWLLLRKVKENKAIVSKTTTCVLPYPLPPAIAGLTFSQRFTQKELTATLVDLAIRGYLTISVGKGTVKLNYTQKPITGLYEYEKLLIEQVLADHGKHNLQEVYANNITLALMMIYDEMVNLGVFLENPRHIHIKWRAVGIIMTLFGCLGMVASAKLLPDPPYIALVFIAIAFAGIAIFDLAAGYTRYTNKGINMLLAWRGFMRYLKYRIDGSHLNPSTKEFISFLPYAIAFGVLPEWQEKFATRTIRPLVWLSSPQPVADPKSIVKAIEKVNLFVGVRYIDMIEPGTD